jgi:flagellar biosynthetic protein FliR
MTLGLPVSTMLAFLLVLARVSGLVMFLPVPGFRAAPDAIRVVLVLSLTFALFPVWPNLPAALPAFGQIVAWALSEAAFGLFTGLCVAFLNEGFQLGAQTFAMQAGYGYASTIDPTSQADSGVLQVITGLITGLLFFTAGIDRAMLRILAASFERFPAGSWTASATTLEGLVHLGSGMFVIGLRMAMPVIALLLLIDLALALLGRVQQQLQLLSLAFPVKMLAALGMLIALAPVIAKLFESAAGRTLAELARLMR